MPVGIEVRTFDKGMIAFCYLCLYQCAQAVNAKIFTDERAKNIAMNNTAFDVLNAITIVVIWLDR